MSISVGCGSWADDEYVGLLHEKGLPRTDRLKAYASHFDHVEVNSSYYATPRAAATAAWVKETPPGFLFDIKLHRAFSQSPEKTARSGKLVDLLLKGVKPLIKAKRLGVFLLVLDPRFGPERHGLEELDTLIEALAPHTLAVEMRHRDWVKGKKKAETLAYFHERKIAWVSVDMPRLSDFSLLPPIDEVTLPALAYLRLHGRNRGYLDAKSAAERHAYAYSRKELTSLGARIRRLAEKAKTVRVVANNHYSDYAPRTALALRDLLSKT